MYGEFQCVTSYMQSPYFHGVVRVVCGWRLRSWASWQAQVTPRSPRVVFYRYLQLSVAMIMSLGTSSVVIGHANVRVNEHVSTQEKVKVVRSFSSG